METITKLIITAFMIFLAIGLAATGIGIPLIPIMGIGVKAMWDEN